MFGRKCSSPGYGFVSGILFYLFFLAALSANLHCGKTLGLEKSFEHGKIFREYGWETRTFEEGKKKAPLIQGGGLRQAHTIEKVENPSSRLLTCDLIQEVWYSPMGPGDKVRRPLKDLLVGFGNGFSCFCWACVSQKTLVDGVKVADYSHIYYSKKWGVTVVVDVLSLDLELTSHHLLMSLEIALTLTGYCA